MNLEGKWKAIFIGGLITGLAPFVPFFNLACCIIPVLGAIVAVAVYRGSEPPPVLTNNDGVSLGLMSGLLGGTIYALILIPLAVFVGGAVGGFVGRIIGGVADIPGNARAIIEGVFSNLGNLLAVIVFVKILGHFALSLIFGILGGILGVALFRRPHSL